MTSRILKNWRVIWAYLNQPLISDYENESIWKPSRFWYIYKIKFLEACWQQTAVIPSHEIRESR